MIPKTQLVAIALAFLLAPIITWAQNSGTFPAGGGGTPPGVPNDIPCNISGLFGACDTGVIYADPSNGRVYASSFLSSLAGASTGIYMDGAGNLFIYSNGARVS
jgi:hypothetical protein